MSKVEFHYSQNKLFGERVIVDSKGINVIGSTLLIKDGEGIKIHPWLTKTGLKYGGYIEYVYDGKIKPDCLGFAESLACNIKNYKGKLSQYVEKETGLKFGYSDAQNIKIAKNPLANKYVYADPKAGEAFAIVSVPEHIKDIYGERPQYRFHIAHVLYRDGDSAITIEAFASLREVENENEEGVPEFGIYDIIHHEQSSKYSFYDAWSSHYKNPSVIVLVPRDKYVPKPKESKAKKRKRSLSPRKSPSKSPSPSDKSPQRKSPRTSPNNLPSPNLSLSSDLSLSPNEERPFWSWL